MSLTPTLKGQLTAPSVDKRLTINSLQKTLPLTIHINGKKATSEEVAALPPNPKGHIAEDGSVWITTEDGSEKKGLTLESNN